MKTLTTRYGELTPQHTTDDLRKKELLPVMYHENGTPKSLPLEHQTSIGTPAGDIPAELITFHENGSLNRVFPLNGKLSGCWSEDDEMAMTRPVTLHTPIGSITTRIISISFYEDEAVRSITLCPGETVIVATPKGQFIARMGISFYPDGSVRSLEPANPLPTQTTAGKVMAYDPDAVGINGDTNSLVFDHRGEVVRVSTTLSQIKAIHPDGRMSCFTPQYRESYCSDTETEIMPMVVEFHEQAVSFSTNPESPSHQIPKKNHLFFSAPYLPQFMQPIELTRNGPA
nr:hypothetical protein [uncultured Pseudodesulfovibrio sp.]